MHSFHRDLNSEIVDCSTVCASVCLKKEIPLQCLVNAGLSSFILNAGEYAFAKTLCFVIIADFFTNISLNQRSLFTTVLRSASFLETCACQKNAAYVKNVSTICSGRLYEFRSGILLSQTAFNFLKCTKTIVDESEWDNFRCFAVFF